MTHTFKNKKGISYLLLDVPEDASPKSFSIEHNRLCFIDMENMPDYRVLNKYGLTPEKGQDDEEFWELANKWQKEQNIINKSEIIGLAKDVSEEVAKEILGQINTEEEYSKSSIQLYRYELEKVVQSLGLNNPIILKLIK